MTNGFILLHRKIKGNWIFSRSDYFHWFCAILLKANFKDNENFLFEGEFMTIKRGQFITSYRNLSNELCGCSIQKLRTFFKLLEKDKIILIENIKKATRITICNYDNYQGSQHDSNTIATQSQHSSNTVATTIERKKSNLNKDNKEKYTNFISKFNEITSKKIRVPDDKFKRQLNARLNEGFTLDEIYKAIKECMKDSHHIETKFKYLTPEFITRADKLQKFLNATTEAKPERSLMERMKAEARQQRMLS